MRPEIFEQVSQSLPLRYEPIFEKLGDPNNQNYWFAVVHDEAGEPMAVVREIVCDDLAVGLDALEALEKYGLKAARHMPFMGHEHREFLLVEYVEGSELGDSNIEPYVLWDHVSKLAHYYTDRISRGESDLSDISAPFQWIVREGVPILVDLDMHAGITTNPELQKLFIGSRLCALYEDYIRLLGTENAERLLRKLDASFKTIVPSDTILAVSEEGTLGPDKERFRY